MKIRLECVKTYFPKGKKWVAFAGKWKAEGNTKEEAKEKMQDAIDWFLRQNEFNNPTIRWSADKKTCLVLVYRFHGYEYTITEPERAYFPCAVLGRISFNEALRRMESHAEQYTKQEEEHGQ